MSFSKLFRPEQTQRAKELSETCGFEYVVSYDYTITDDEPAKYGFKQAVQNGKIALSIECGKLGNVQKEAVSLIKKRGLQYAEKNGKCITKHQEQTPT